MATFVFYWAFGGAHGGGGCVMGLFLEWPGASQDRPEAWPTRWKPASHPPSPSLAHLPLNSPLLCQLLIIVGSSGNVDVFATFAQTLVGFFSGPKSNSCLALWVSSVIEFCSNLICQSCYMDFSKLLDGFVKIDFNGFLWFVTWICQNWYMDEMY